LVSHKSRFLTGVKFSLVNAVDLFPSFLTLANHSHQHLSHHSLAISLMRTLRLINLAVIAGGSKILARCRGGKWYAVEMSLGVILTPMSFLGLGLVTHLFVKVLRPGDSKVTFSVFESSCHLLQGTASELADLLSH